MACTIKKIVERVWADGSFTVAKSDVEGLDLSAVVREGIISNEEGDSVTFVRFTESKPQVAPVTGGRPYVMPSFANEVFAIGRHCTTNFSSFNILLSGPAGCGKTEFVREFASQAGYERVFQINGRNDMSSTDFFGEKTIVIDRQSGQNHISFEKGILYQAFVEGTEVDGDGNQVLYDADGNISKDGEPRVVGKPGLFFLDEFAAVMPEVFLSVFNRAMEIPRAGKSRSIEISADGGRIVKSHPGFAIFLAGNTVGHGTDDLSQMGYTAQNNQMDESTLNRITATYQFGYSLDAEKQIIGGNLCDDYQSQCLARLVADLRRLWQDNHVETLLSTRDIVKICELAKVFEGVDMNHIPKAIYRSVFSGLRSREKSAWNESIRNIYGVDLLNDEVNKNKNVFFATKNE